MAADFFAAAARNCRPASTTGRDSSGLGDSARRIALAQLLPHSARGLMLTATARDARSESLSLRVLIVDDEALIRWSLAETLVEAGHRVAEAADGEAALESCSKDAEFDVVLLDYHLPDSNDLGLLASIRRLAPQAVVIMMTAFGTQEMIEEALRLGAYQIAPKPFDVHDIESLVLQAHASRPTEPPR
jgi:CheY-like chemotaxis protein